MTLTDFLDARINEDEARTRSALRDNGPNVDDGVWVSGNHPSDESRIWGIGLEIYDEGGHSAEQARHIAHHDPARVMTQCQAKRAIIEIEVLRFCDNVPRSGFVSLEIADTIRGRADTPILRALACEYAGHPDYDPEWAE